MNMLSKILVQSQKVKEFNQLDNTFVIFLTTCKVSSYSEDSKLKFILQWIKADVENRRKYFIEMVKRLNLERVTFKYGSFLVKHENLCFEFPEFMKMLYLANDAQCGDDDVDLPQSSLRFKEALILFDKTSNSLQLFQPVNKELKILKKLNEFITEDNCTAVVLKEFIYVLLSNQKVYRINVWKAESSWAKMQSMMMKHGKYLRAAVHGDYIYVCGNYTMERYSHADDKWEEIECSDIQCKQSALVEYQDDIYVIGGFIRGKRVDKYSSSTGTWSSMKSMGRYRRIPAATTHAGKIYVAGGCDSSYTAVIETECFDSQANTWTNLASMTIARDTFSLCVVYNNLFAVGNRSKPYSIEKYDPDENQWEKVIELPDMEMMYAATVAIRLPLYGV